MTVKELINKLKKFPSNDRVYHLCTGEGTIELEEITKQHHHDMVIFHQAICNCTCHRSGASVL